jgi:iturin family lipopeptide synthetase B
VFENYPVAQAIQTAPTEKGAFRITAVDIFEQVNYDFNLVVLPGEEMLIELFYNSKKYDAASMKLVLYHFGSIIEQLSKNAGAEIGDIALYDIDDQKVDELSYTM